MEDKLFEKEYSIPYQMFNEAYDAFQKKYRMGNYLYTVWFTVLGISFVFAAIKDPSRILTYFLMLTCFAFAAIRWYTPKRIKRSYMEVLKETENDRYKFELYDDHISISIIEDGENESAEEENAEKEKLEPTKLYFAEGLNMLEKGGFFIVYQRKELFYVIPKKGFAEEELEIFREKINDSVSK